MGADELRVLTEGADSAGGFLVPEDFMNAIIKRLAGYAIVRGLATVFQTSRDSVLIPRVGGGAAPTSTDVYTSAVRLTWVGETMTDDEGLTDPDFEMVRVPIEKAIAKTRISRDLLMDSVTNVVELLAGLFAEAFGLGEDNAFLTGSGISQPFGVMNDTVIPTVNLGNPSTADGIIDLF